MKIKFRKADAELSAKIIERETEFAKNRLLLCSIVFAVLMVVCLAMVSAIYAADLRRAETELLGYDPSAKTAQGQIDRYGQDEENMLKMRLEAEDAARAQAKADLRGERAALYIGALSAAALGLFIVSAIITRRLRRFRNSGIYVCHAVCVTRSRGEGRHGRCYVTVETDGNRHELPVTGRTYSFAHPGDDMIITSIDRSAWSIDAVYAPEELENRMTGEDRILDI